MLNAPFQLAQHMAKRAVYSQSSWAPTPLGLTKGVNQDSILTVLPLGLLTGGSR